MTQQHPITPPPELVQRLYGLPQMRAIEAAFQAGADWELEACCEWLQHDYPNIGANALRAARRPKPQSLNSIALEMVGAIERDAHYLPEITDTIRRALEQLND